MLHNARHEVVHCVGGLASIFQLGLGVVQGADDNPVFVIVQGDVIALGLTVTVGITAAFPISVSIASTKEQPLTFTTLPVEALLLPLRMPLFCSFEIIALVGCGIGQVFFSI